MEPRHEQARGLNQPTAAELAAFGAFSDELVQGRSPCVEGYLGQVPEEHRQRLREELDATAWFHGLVKQYKETRPGLRLSRLLLRRARRASQAR